MRESVGATWLTQIVITFILLFSAIICYAVNYGKAFKVKNQIVEDIESAGSPAEASDNIGNYLQNVGYSSTFELSDEEKKGECKAFGRDGKELSGQSEGYYHVCQVKIENDGKTCQLINGKWNGDVCRAYYKVYVVWGFDLPIVGNLLKFKMSGTTKPLSYNSADWYK